ncbi:DUF3152 domain-containing protein [Streptomyces sp. enrichment culture]|uniref:DUF3152 domain-containing protein n=1 Tax=Streptomyces sp. enrichment culture TaxID=1795815 RepID=UPI003F552980
MASVENILKRPVVPRRRRVGEKSMPVRPSLSLSLAAVVAVSFLSACGTDSSASDGGKAEGDRPLATDSGPVPGVLQHGNGEFDTAQPSGQVHGDGSKVRRFAVMVEEGTGVSADKAAREVEKILADERGWTADGVNAFQLVSEKPYDFVIDIASPDTADRICAEGDLDTRGELNCDVGHKVVVNLKRWLTGSPEFSGPTSEYRALIVNHEVGHRIGHGHEGCPGPGKPAPAMMQQIYGLDGCEANAWPYDTKGNYLGGPPVKESKAGD